MNRLVNLLMVIFIIRCFSANSQTISNIAANQFNQEVIITYNLNDALPSEQFYIKAICLNGDENINLENVTGNGIGRNVRGGLGKQIIWTVTSDMELLQGDDIKFKIIGTKITQEEEVILSRGGSSISDQKHIIKTEFSTEVDNYLEQVYNLVTVFRNFGDRAFESRADYERLRTQVEKTNLAYDKLLPKKESYKQSIRSLWGSEAINCEVNSFMGKILEDLHRTFILPLNNTIKDINQVITDEGIKKSEREKRIERIKIELDIRTSQLIELVNSSKGDAKALYILIE